MWKVISGRLTGAQNNTFLLRWKKSEPTLPGNTDSEEIVPVFHFSHCRDSHMWSAAVSGSFWIIGDWAYYSGCLGSFTGYGPLQSHKLSIVWLLI